MRRTLLVCAVCALVLVAGARADDSKSTIRLETGAMTALNSTADLGVALSVGAELPRWIPVIGCHIGFLDALQVNSRKAIGASVSLRPAATDDGWRIGATVTKPDSGAGGEWTAYMRYGVEVKLW